MEYSYEQRELGDDFIICMNCILLGPINTIIVNTTLGESHLISVPQITLIISSPNEIM